ncbi:MAG: hypothetical protein BEN19_02230 [Epulopiscium sp. Nuni2H_MBin003]|nr:MAG: hypothetical protein BEN19_02230 [Epulopiscium sp. Nuni2H_MBin003]
MKKFILENLPWKLLSFVIAILVWIMVINIQNPVTTTDINNIKVDIIGLEQIEQSDQVVKDMDKIYNLSVDIKIKGQRLTLENIGAKDIASAYINLTPYVLDVAHNTDITEHLIPIEVSLDSDNIVVDNYNPKSIYVSFEAKTTRVFPVKYTMSGSVDSEYRSIEPVIRTVAVELSGAKSTIENIAEILVDINVDNIVKDIFVYDLPLLVYDKDGNLVSDVEKSTNNIQVILPMGAQKTVPLQARFSGTLPSGYVQTNTIITPSEITIIGNAESINEIDEIQLDYISVANLIENTTRQVDFILPDGIEYIDKIDSNAVVTLEIQKINTHDFKINTNTLNLDVIGLRSDLSYEIIQPQLLITLGGASETLLGFDENNMVATLDLTSFKEGSYSLPLKIELNEELKIINNPITLDVIIKE